MTLDLGNLPRRWWLELVGVLLLAALTWFVGPYVAIAEWTPLESAIVRAILVLLFVAGWLASVLVRKQRSQRASDRIEEAIVSDRAGGERDEKLRRQFEEAVAFLKRSRGGKNLYELPWYVLVGPPGSGKTTALKNSGLNFPLDRKFGKNALRGVGGTRNCDWWFTDEAVLLDTAGRYFSQDSDEISDSAEWSSFLDLLSTYRKRRPINGVIVAFSARDLMEMRPSDHERHVSTIRRRVEEIQKQLRIQVPIYFLVTKCDLVSGFVEFFDEMDQEQRNQVWGMTRPAPTEGESDLDGWFQREFDLLVQRLDEQVLERLSRERATQRRARLFGFPRQIEAMREALAALLEDAFAPNRYDASMMLRGVYFTSGTQEGTPIDRLMESLAESYGVAAALQAETSERVQSRSFFLHDALRRVVFAEQGLAGINWRFEVGRAVAQNAAYVAALAAMTVLIVTWVAGYRANKGLFTDIETCLVSNDAVLAQAQSCDIGVVLPRLEAMRACSDVANQYENDRPLYMGLGMYRGSAVGEVARANYHQAVGAQLVPLLAGRFVHGIKGSASDPSRLFAYLKGYLMLADAGHRDAKELALIVGFLLREGSDADAAQADHVLRHLDSVLAAGGDWPAPALDKVIVDGARQSLKIAGTSELMLSRAKMVYDTHHAQALPLERELGLKASSVFRRRSGVALSEPIPALFTKPVFQDLQSIEGGKMVVSLLSDRWVVDPDAGALDVAAQARMAGEFLDAYEKQYITFWEELIKDVQLVALPSNPTAAKELIVHLTGSMSPLRAWFGLINQHTDFTPAPPPAAGTAAGAIAAVETTVAGTLAGMLSTRSGPKPGMRITEQFRPYRDANKALGDIEPVLNELYMALDAMSGAPVGGGGNAGHAAQIKRIQASLTMQAGKLPGQTKGIFGPLTGTTKDIAESADSAEIQGSIWDTYKNTVLPDCRDTIAGRYPFSGSATQEVATADFARFFAPGGVIDGFFNEVLAQRVDVAGNSWTWKKGDPAAKLPASFLRQFRLARQIRDIFFSKGPEPKVGFKVSVERLDSSAQQIRWFHAGESLTYRHGSATPKYYEWPSAGDDRAGYEFELYNSERPMQERTGAWGLLRLLDSTRPEATGSGSAYRLRLAEGAARADLLVEFVSARNPLSQREWRDFRCSESLQ